MQSIVTRLAMDDFAEHGPVARMRASGPHSGLSGSIASCRSRERETVLHFRDSRARVPSSGSLSAA